MQLNGVSAVILLHFKPLQNSVASDSPFILLLFYCSGILEFQLWDFLCFTWHQLGDGLEDSFPQWLLHSHVQHLGTL